MPKNNMKATDYYKSGRMKEASIKGGEKARQLTLEKLYERIRVYDTAPNKCQYCQKSLTYQQRNNKFCSSKCSAISTNLVRFPDRAKRFSREEWLEAYRNRPFEELSWEAKRQRVIEEQNGKCAGCSLSEWRGQPITLEVDHKDGDHTNSVRDNLEAVCPNCHSQTPTFRGRNKNHNKEGGKKVEDDVLIFALQQTSSIRQALLMVGLSPRGGNYKRAKKLNGSMVK